jgi:hypothetical protein
MRKAICSTIVVLAVLGGGAMRAQDSNVHPSPEKRESATHLEFSINELEDGKKINVRHYSMNLTEGSSKDLKIGTRVPVEAEQGKFQYLDIGTSIHARIYGKDDAPVLDVQAEVSNLAVSDQGTRLGQPIVRQMIISGNTILVYDKPIVVGAVDDPNSKRQYQLEVTATKMK